MLIVSKLQLRHSWYFLVLFEDSILSRSIKQVLSFVIFLWGHLQGSDFVENTRMVDLLINCISLQVVNVICCFLLFRFLVKSLFSGKLNRYYLRHLLECILHKEVQIILWFRALRTARIFL